MSRVQGRGGHPRVLATVSLAGLLALSGCVERRYTIRTNPPGALAIVNDEEIGPTPVSRNFTYYAPRKITLIADGYQTQTIIQPMKAPWYDNLITEFFTENLVPWTVRDDREFYYSMTPATSEPDDAVTSRGDAFRQMSQSAPEPPPARWGLRRLFGW